MNTIDSSRLLAEMSRMVQAANGGNESSPTSNEISSSSSSKIQNSFGDLLTNAIGGVNELQMQSGNLSDRLVKGDPDVTIAETMIAGQKASIAFEATLQVRNKLVQAYQDIMNMPL